MRTTLALSLAVALAAGVSGCDTTNRAPGNDREAAVARPQPPAAFVDATQATANVAPAAVQPETLDPVDVDASREAGPCRFRLTRADFPTVLYGPAQAVIKVNGRRVSLPASSPGHYGAGAIRLDLAMPAGSGLQATLLQMHVGDDPDERGYAGFAECGAPAAA